MVQQTHTPQAELNSLPGEVLDLIVGPIIAQDRPSARNLACANKRLQSMVYRSLYSVLRVKSTELDLLRRLDSPRYRFLEEMVFEHELPSYDCNECNTLMSDSEVETSSKIFRSTLRQFLAIIARHNPRFGTNVRLSLDLFCPSDHEHWKLHHHTKIASSVAHTHLEELYSELHIFKTKVDLGHRFSRFFGEVTIEPSGVLRPFTMTSIPHPSETRPSETLPSEEQLPNNPHVAFKELYISRQMCRQLDPMTMIMILECMPKLKRLHYEKWKTSGNEPDLSLKILNTALQISCLQSLTIYEEQCSRLSRALKMQRSRKSARTPADGSRVLPVFPVLPPILEMDLLTSHSIQELSLSNFVDGCTFFKHLETTQDYWPALSILTLTMMDFTSDPSKRRLISYYITKAALLLPKLPSLDTMQLYNDSLNDACIFTCRNYGTGQDQRPATVTWRSAWEFTFSGVEKNIWNNAIAARRGEGVAAVFFERPVDIQPNTTHMQVLKSLGVASSVLSHRSCVVKGVEDGLRKRPYLLPQPTRKD